MIIALENVRSYIENQASFIGLAMLRALFLCLLIPVSNACSTLNAIRVYGLQYKPTMQTHTPFYRSECHSAVFPSFRFSSSFTRSASCCGPFRLPTQLQVSKSAELPLVSARATMRSASALTPRSASWMLVWLVRFEQRRRRESKRRLAQKGREGNHIWPLMSTLPNADCFAPSNRLPALPVVTRTSPSFSCTRCCPPYRAMKSRQVRSWSDSNTDSSSSTAKPSSWVRNVLLTSGLYLRETVSCASSKRLMYGDTHALQIAVMALTRSLSMNMSIKKGAMFQSCASL